MVNVTEVEQSSHIALLQLLGLLRQKEVLIRDLTNQNNVLRQDVMKKTATEAEEKKKK